MPNEGPKLIQTPTRLVRLSLRLLDCHLVAHSSDLRCGQIGFQLLGNTLTLGVRLCLSGVCRVCVVASLGPPSFAELRGFNG